MEKRPKLHVDAWTTARIGVVPMKAYTWSTKLYTMAKQQTWEPEQSCTTSSSRCKVQTYTCWLVFVYLKPMKAKSLNAQPMKVNAKIPVYQKLSSPGRTSCARL